MGAASYGALAHRRFVARVIHNHVFAALLLLAAQTRFGRKGEVRQFSGF